MFKSVIFIAIFAVGEVNKKHLDTLF